MNKKMVQNFLMFLTLIITVVGISLVAFNLATNTSQKTSENQTSEISNEPLDIALQTKDHIISEGFTVVLFSSNQEVDLNENTKQKLVLINSEFNKYVEEDIEVNNEDNASLGQETSITSPASPQGESPNSKNSTSSEQGESFNTTNSGEGATSLDNSEDNSTTDTQTEEQLVTSRFHKYLYGVEVTNISKGDNVIKVSIAKKGSVDFEKNLSIKVEREFSTLPFGKEFIEPWPDSSYVLNGDDLNVYISKEKSTRLLPYYEPIDLKDLNKDFLLYTNLEGILLRQQAGQSLQAMLLDLQAQLGKNVVILSGYRSYANQVQTYSNWVRQVGIDEADKSSARPGYSEHQLGTAVDIWDGEDGSDTFNSNFDSTAEGKWILENSWKYGFIQTLPVSTNDQTGYIPEPWHYRFVGYELAEQIKESGKTWMEFNI
jgi:LAS superfamily LD-carboxypeptidase LdcB